jgi:hypothetical protein
MSLEKTMNKSELLRLWSETEPTARSCSFADGEPPMWLTYYEDDYALFTRPSKVSVRDEGGALVEVDGVQYSWRRDLTWLTQLTSVTFEEFASTGPTRSGPSFVKDKPLFSEEFDWNYRVSGEILVLPFIERVPRPEHAAEMTKWLKDKKDRYVKRFVRMYHGTDPSLLIEQEGLKPTSATRRRSFQSESGYVYLANTPSRAQNFGRLGNQGRCDVFEVLVDVSQALPDKDQLNNQRVAGMIVGNTIGESIVYGGGVRVKGKIEPWAIRRLSDAEIAHIETRNRRLWLVEQLSGKPGVAGVFWECARAALALGSGSLHDVNWLAVERSTIRWAMVEGGYEPESIKADLLALSPTAVDPAHGVLIDRYIAQVQREQKRADSFTETQPIGRRSAMRP